MTIRHKLLHTSIWLVAIYLLAWTLWQLPLASINTWIAGLEIYQWIIWVLLNLIIILIYVTRWHLINIGLEYNIFYLPLLLIRQAGQAISYITPGPQFGGEPLQVYWLIKKTPITGQGAILSVAIDRFFELWINFLILITGIVVLILAYGTSVANWYFPLSIIVILITGLMFVGYQFSRHDSFLVKWVKKSLHRWKHSPRLQNLELQIETITIDVRKLINQHRSKFYLAIGFSILGWAGMLMEIGLILSFLDIQLGINEFILLVVAMRLALLLPVPGGIGTTESAVFWVFISLGLNTFDVMGMIALMRLRDIIIVLSGMGAFRYLMKNIT